MSQPTDTVVRTAETAWKTLRTPGISIKILRDDKATGASTYTPPEGKHAAGSEGGCLVLVTLPRPVEILAG